jgi:hypothetical protein
MRFTEGTKISLETALGAVFNDTLVDNTDIIFDKVFVTNSEVVTLVNTLYDIDFANKHTTFQIEEFLLDAKGCGKIERVDIDHIKANIKGGKIVHKKYNKTPAINLDKFKADSKSIIKSKRWVSAGQRENEYGEIEDIKPKKPVEFTEFKRIMDEVYPNMRKNQLNDVFKSCVKVVTDTQFAHDGESWADFSWYELSILKLEKKLDEMAILAPYVRNKKIDAILAD